MNPPMECELKNFPLRFINLFVKQQEQQLKPHINDRDFKAVDTSNTLWQWNGITGQSKAINVSQIESD